MQYKKQNLFLLVFILLIGLIGCCWVLCSKDKSIIKQEKVVIKPMQKTDRITADNAVVKEEEISPEEIKPKLKDTTVVLFLDDLSYTFNYKIIDNYFCNNFKGYYDSCFRTIKIYNKQDSLLQKIIPDMQITPWYFMDSGYPLSLSRSYITGKNKDVNDADNYCGEMAVADLNFDGLEDFATPIGCGADNGPHYAFYIQSKLNKFTLNRYLTENVIWFPDQINDSLKTITNAVPCTVIGLNYTTYKYLPKTNKWKRTEEYLIDIRTGKLMK